MTPRTDDTLTVIDRHGVTILQRPAGVRPDAQRIEAIGLAAKVNGKVFQLDRFGFLTRIWPETNGSGR